MYLMINGGCAYVTSSVPPRPWVYYQETTILSLTAFDRVKHKLVRMVLAE